MDLSSCDAEDVMAFVDSFLRSRGFLDEQNNLRSDIDVDLYADSVQETTTADNSNQVEPTSPVNVNETPVSVNENVSEAHNLETNCSTLLINQSPSKSRKRSRSSSPNVKSKSPHSSEKQSLLYLKECPICLELLFDKKLATTQCGHVFCLDCLKHVAGTMKKCPLCRRKVLKSNIIQLHCNI